MAQKYRRVVTGHDKNGVAKVIMDEEASCILQRPNRPGVTLTNLWQHSETPAPMEIHEDPVTGPLILHPPENGAVFRIVQFDPEDPEVLAKLDGATAFAEMGAGANVVQGARHPFMHRTDSLDYSIILSGEIYMLMDEEDVLLKAGDVVIQQGTNHAWSNRGTEPCMIMFVLNHATK
ncbi:Cupin domain-containing protein [Shimia isoporae]|uniref:Cupin domain-containing protein n=1 Tax=Shimia isoporae TaxID=647720 RepID=A0A4R1NJB2_9RHOB|nr:cupin domain-containing protein [Shimia isoporae]TCL08337.1 Cupin domain-containing protein [Shimia isoporae]